MDMIGMKFGKFTVIEECEKRVRGVKQINVQCECGMIRMYNKAIFTHGTHPEKCFKCHLKLQKSMKMSTTRKNWTE